ncbi:nuclear hormone receptor HR96-like [Uranotaenia lowii]|uniref:nuclear hormone receptor HR96-like n=1 Tax=Uranotaenia lowii TaxID=190385 RepID=UPI00247AD708|nr:nuclear hormone receptor HR96-like [Uranotaenia lowii]
MAEMGAENSDKSIDDNSSVEGKMAPGSAGSGQPKICSVCGDKALGYNFNAMTCESCKAFFRRNALSTKGFTCPFSESCEITVVTRRFCQKCRLDKCFQIGMKKEYIMSEEDKALKRKKIEQNRAKKRISTVEVGKSIEGNVPMKIKREGSDSDCWSNSPSDILTLDLAQHPGSVGGSQSLSISGGSSSMYNGMSSPNDMSNSPSSSSAASCHNMIQNNHENQPTVERDLLSAISVLVPQASASGDSGTESQQLPALSLESSPSEIVNRIVNHPTLASQTIASLMPTPKDAVYIMSKIINSQCDALKLISHFITAPGDALQIISKIMNSPLDALTVFAQFMSSPTDALQIIGKIMSSPADVLQFMQQLMNQPEDAVQIMNKFMNAPAEALQMINRMMNHSDVIQTIKEAADTSQRDDEEDHLKSLMVDPQPVPPTSTPIPESSSASPSSTSHCEIPGPQQSHPLLFETHQFLQIPPTPEEPSTLSTNLDFFLSSPFQDIESKPILPNTLEAILEQAIRLEYEGGSSSTSSTGGLQHQLHHHHHHHSQQQQQLQHSQQLPASSAVGFVNNSIELNDAERAKLNELIVANKALYAPVDEDLATLISDDCRIKSNQNQPDPKLLTVINLTAIAIRRLIKMSKKISAFKNMCQEDQLALLKAGCTEMMILRSAMQYDCDRATWKIPHSQEEMSNIRADVLKLAKGNVYQEHERFIRTFDQKWRSDENIILIMCAITLFSPDRPKTVHSDVIKLEQNSYYYLLRRYLESIYVGCEARSVFLKLMQKISELHRLNDEIISVYLDVNPAQVEPLLREIFDLKVLS